MFFFCILHYHLHCTINYHEPRSITIHYDPLRFTTIHYDPLRSTTTHFSIACTLSIHTRSQIDQTQSHRWKAPRIPRRCPAWTTTSTTKVKGVHVSVLANSTHADPPSLVFFLCCVLCFSLSLSPSLCCRFKSWHHVARSKLQSGTFVRHTGHDRTGSTRPSRRRGCGHRQWSRRYVKCVIMIHVGGTGIVSLPVQDENTDSDHFGWCIDSNM